MRHARPSPTDIVISSSFKILITLLSNWILSNITICGDILALTVEIFHVEKKLVKEQTAEAISMSDHCRAIVTDFKGAKLSVRD